MPANCPKCNAHILPSEGSCYRCGLAFDSPDPTISNAAPTPTPAFTNSNIPWQHQDGIIICCLILCFPLGLFLMWRSPRWQRATKGIVTVLGLPFFLAIAGSGIYYNLTPAGKADMAAQAQADARQERQEQQREAEAAIPPNVKRFPALAKFPALIPLLDGDNAGDPPKPKLKDFEYTNDANGGGVTIEINMDEMGLSSNKAAVETEVSDIYTALYKDKPAPLDLADVRYFATPVSEDRYGNQSKETALVYATKLTSDEAHKVNWQADKLDLEQDILPHLWETYENHQGEF